VWDDPPHASRRAKKDSSTASVIGRPDRDICRHLKGMGLIEGNQALALECRQDRAQFTGLEAP